MSASVRYVGIDVHKESITLAVAEDGPDAAKENCSVPNVLKHVLKALRQLRATSKLRCWHESGTPISGHIGPTSKFTNGIRSMPVNLSAHLPKAARRFRLSVRPERLGHQAIDPARL